jgi:hypothetical protein
VHAAPSRARTHGTPAAHLPARHAPQNARASTTAIASAATAAEIKASVIEQHARAESSLSRPRALPPELRRAIEAQGASGSSSCVQESVKVLQQHERRRKMSVGSVKGADLAGLLGRETSVEESADGGLAELTIGSLMSRHEAVLAAQDALFEHVQARPPPPHPSRPPAQRGAAAAGRPALISLAWVRRRTRRRSSRRSTSTTWWR